MYTWTCGQWTNASWLVGLYFNYQFSRFSFRIHPENSLFPIKILIYPEIRIYKEILWKISSFKI